ncbi:MAG: hypothetical protein Kow00121_60610 [Elainellaceae cyanobacterium]
MLNVKNLSASVLVATCITAASAVDAPSVVAATVTTQSTIQRDLNFFGGQGLPSGTGSFEYSQDPIEGLFMYGTGSLVGGIGFLFVEDRSQVKMPQEFVPVQSISISASDNFRLVTQISIDITGSLFERNRSVLTSRRSFDDILLFKPSIAGTYPSADGSVFTISTGDPRRPSLGLMDGWFLGDKGGGPSRQLSINQKGSFWGFDLKRQDSQVFLGGQWEVEKPQATNVPTPATLPGLLGIGIAALRKRKNKTSKRVAESTTA